MDRVKVSIIGAGIIGLAIAERLSRKINGNIVVFEKYDSFGQETSSRNSEVIHAGIYYPRNSLKSRLCLQGNKMLYDLCQKTGIKHKKCGKILVSTNEKEIQQIQSIYSNAVSIGVPELKLLTKEEIKELESNIFAMSGIFSGSTGIIDSHGLMGYLFKQAETQNVMFAFESEIISIEKTTGGYMVKTANEEEVLSEIVINCAGLSSDKIAQMVGLDINSLGYKLHYCKGDYFSISGSKGRLRHLVYPVPHENGYGLGVHATLDLEGYIRLGPDANYVDKISYDVDPSKRAEFYNSAKTYLPWLIPDMLAPDTSGVRPKLQGPNDGFRDFVIKEGADNGFSGFVNLIGIESPGLTAALAIGEHTARLLERFLV